MPDLTGPSVPADSSPQDLARYLAASTGLAQPTAIRVIADVANYFDETVEELSAGGTPSSGSGSGRTKRSGR